MSIKTGASRLSAKLTMTMAVGAVAAVLLPALPAHAIGNNRTVYRGCGANYVSSGYYTYNTYAWAQTQRESGSCLGRLSAGLEALDGYRWPRVYGTRESAYTSRQDSAGFGRGMHWGCDACSVTYS